jgi:FlaG/FlaF family flagellin (archaellin)
VSTAFNIIAVIFMIAVVFVLIRGLINMMRGGSGRTSNKLMQARIALQFFALVFLLLTIYFARNS